MSTRRCPASIILLDAALIGDAKLGLTMLNQALANTKRPLDAARIEDAKEQKFAKFQALAESAERPIKPERVVAELGRALDPDAIVVADAGTPCPYFSAYYQVRGTGRRFFSNRAHGALGYSMAAAMGAHFAQPQVKCVSVMGDGSFGFTCGELETAARYRLPITFIVIANASYGWIKAGQKSGLRPALLRRGFRGHRSCRGRRRFRRQELARHRTQRFGKVLKAALGAAEPTLVDIVCQPLHEAKAPVSEWIA